MNGIIILNKPIGISSNTACRKVGKMLGEKKVGHLGTLDVLASGVLPITLGRYTKLFDFFLQKQKKYLAEFTFGYETSTLDSEGEIISKSSKIPTEAEILSVLSQLIGVQMQLPPKYSAKKINGKCAYELARNNIEFEVKPKEIEIYSIKLLSKINSTTFQLEIECSSGTYIRSIARDLAYLLNTKATMTNLVRTRCGNFDIEKSYTFAEIENLNTKAILCDECIFEGMPTINIENNLLFSLLNGMNVYIPNNNQNEEIIAVYCKKEIIGLGALNDGYLKLSLHLKIN